MPCKTCAPPDSPEFNAEAALKCRICFPDGPLEFETIDEFEKNFVENYTHLAEQLLEVDWLYLKSLPKKISKKQLARERKERLAQMAAARGREVLEKKPKKKKEEPIVHLRIFDGVNESEEPVENYTFDCRNPIVPGRLFFPLNQDLKLK